MVVGSFVIISMDVVLWHFVEVYLTEAENVDKSKHFLQSVCDELPYESVN